MLGDKNMKMRTQYLFPKDWVTGTGPRYVDERLEQCIIAIIYLYKEVLNSAKKSQSWHPLIYSQSSQVWVTQYL